MLLEHVWRHVWMACHSAQHHDDRVVGWTDSDPLPVAAQRHVVPIRQAPPEITVAGELVLRKDQSQFLPEN